MTFAARYPGRCGSCDEPIQPGDQVEYTDAGGVLVHTDCDDLPHPERDAPICPTCWLTQPCDCAEEL